MSQAPASYSAVPIETKTVKIPVPQLSKVVPPPAFSDIAKAGNDVRRRLQSKSCH